MHYFVINKTLDINDERNMEILEKTLLEKYRCIKRVKKHFLPTGVVIEPHKSIGNMYGLLFSGTDKVDQLAASGHRTLLSNAWEMPQEACLPVEFLHKNRLLVLPLDMRMAILTQNKDIISLVNDYLILYEM